MKILFAIQATGNGHISRAREIIPYMQQYGELDLLLSGTQADVGLPYPIAYYVYGTSFIFGKKGGVDIKETLKKARPFRFFKDVFTFPIDKYDVIINDFEPVTAWACKARGKKCYGLSHQGAFLSDKTPRPAKRIGWAEWFMRNYSPVTDLTAFHFDKYDDFIRTPVVRSEIRNATVSHGDHIAVYMPALDDKKQVEYFSQCKSVRWKVFSKHTKKHYTHENVEVHPVSNTGWVEAMASAEGVLIGAGFEGPAETLCLGKKLLTIPMIGQYEQHCNAAAMEQLGVKVIWKITNNFVAEIKDWLHNVKPIKVDFPDETEWVVKDLFEQKIK